MTYNERRNIVTTASNKIFADFLWLKRNTKTPYASSEFVINDKYSIFAFEEFDEDDEDDRWITVTMERYNDRGRCVDDFVVTAIANTVSKQSLSGAISTLINMFEHKTNDLDALELSKTYLEFEKEEDRNFSQKTIKRIHWLFDETDFTEAQIASIMDIDINTIHGMRKEWDRCAI